jgi:hypothetical protein
MPTFQRGLPASGREPGDDEGWPPQWKHSDEAKAPSKIALSRPRLSGFTMSPFLLLERFSNSVAFA